MTHYGKHLRLGAFLAYSLSAWIGFAHAAAISIPSGPLYIGAAVQPLVMLDITKDQNLYKKAYDDYTDLNGDGWAETTYDHTIDYYGYFDSYKCYSYSSTNNYFSPVGTSLTTDSNGDPIKPSNCGGQWHGNFLNWATMSRMDTTRKLLYGGMRSTDSSTNTVLERAFIPTDAHSWAKYYNPYIAKQMDTWPGHQSNINDRYPDINKLTPFAPTAQPVGVASTSTASFGGSQVAPSLKTFDITGNTGKFSYGDQVLIEDAGTASSYMIGSVSCVNTGSIAMYDSLVSGASTCSANQLKVVVENSSVSTGSSSNWKIYNFTQTGISMCNASPDANTATSQNSTAVPKMRVAQGNFSLWSANERWQCLWREDSSSPAEVTNALSAATRTQGNRAALSGIWASSLGPNKTTVSNGRVKNGLDSDGFGPDYVVRVQACVSSALIGKEKCEKYPSNNYKPIGLLQYYGESGLLTFGLMTGSYIKNKSGGVLRKNISNISDEINTTTDGSFKPTIPTTGSIIQTLNRMRIWGYNYADGIYSKDGTDGATTCSWGQTDITEGTCLSWGNPMSEVYLESLRYLAGKSATTAFNVTADKLSLPSPTWSDPLSTSNYCAPLNVLVFNSAVSSYEHDSQMGGASDLGTTGNFGDAAIWTDKVGTQEGINTKSWFVGNNGSGSTPTDLCSSKTVSNFSSVYGICPEGAGTEGSYLMDGVSYFVHTNQIRNPTALSVPSSNTTALKVSTFGIALASNTPKRTITVGTSKVTFMPQGRLGSSSATSFGSGALVDWKIVCEIPIDATAATIATITKASAGRCSSAGTGAFYWNSDDSEQGGDYDQDMWGRLQYQISSSANNTVMDRVSITTDVLAQSTGSVFGFGYAISGTSKDGPHFHSGINSFSFTDVNAATITGDTTNISSNTCSGCIYSNKATTATYTVSSTATDTVLKDTLWYAAKYGGFNDKNGNNQPDQTSEWDVRNSDGSTTNCTTDKCDGDPDNFFLVTNPAYLEDALDKAFIAMLGESSASSVATNSTSLQTGSRIYQARFNSNDWSGQLRALDLDATTGAVKEPEIWDSGQKINAQKTATSDTRNIITMGVDTSPKQGIAFTWAAITGQSSTAFTQRDALNSNGLGTYDSSSNLLGSARLDYVRGLQTKEGKSAVNFRERNTSRLGDIVNSSPTYVGVPEAGWGGSTYKSFRSAHLARTPVLYTGANDGMLHAFKASDGSELLAYVPSVFYNNLASSSNLSQLTNLSYSHKFFVDGTPMVNDIETGSGSTLAWKTVLVGGLNWGGRAYYALDVTDPDGTGDPELKFAEAKAKNIVMWEFSNANDSDLGYTFTQPSYPSSKGIANQIVKMRNGKWAVIVGNGYNSDSGKSALFIFFLDRAKDSNGVYSTTWTLGTDYVKIVADMQVPSNYGGLSTPIPFSALGDGIIDWVYAGDLNGNLWKFDVSDADSTKWSVAYNTGACTSSNTTSTCTPLFYAKDSSNNRQPITTAPQVVRHPNGGAMVLFGTGKYLETSDTTTPFKTQTYYGVWDNGSNKGLVRASLLQQKVAGVTTVGTNNYRVTTDYCVVAGSVSGKDVANANAAMVACNDDWSSSTAKEGWYMDLPTSGERIAYNGILQGSRVVFNTLIPSTIPCEAGGTSWLMDLDALTGRRLTVSPYDVNGDGLFNVSDKVTLSNSASVSFYVGGTQSSNGGIHTTPTAIKINEEKGSLYSSSSSGNADQTNVSADAANSGRISWREITQ